MKTHAALALVALLLASAAPAKERYGVTAPPTMEAGGATLQLMGMGLRKKLFFKVYLASFYLQKPTDDAKEAVASDQVKRVQMNMLRDLERGKILEALREGFEKNAGANLPALKDRLVKFEAAIPDLKENQSLSVTYVPGKGTTVAANGVDKVVIEGKDFADALFSVWIGAHPVDDELKEEMLRNR